MSTPAGWYDDGSGRQRWWDGSQWTERYADDGADASAPAGDPTSPAGTDAGPGASAADGPLAPAYSVPAASPVAEGPRRTPMLGFVGLGLAVLGTILVCVPTVATFWVGALVLFAAFVVSLIAVFQKGAAKWPSIVGMVLSVVGGIIGVIVLVFTLASAIADIPNPPVGLPTSATIEPSDPPATGDSEGRPSPEAIGRGYKVMINAGGYHQFDDDPEFFTCMGEHFYDSDLPDDVLRDLAQGVDNTTGAEKDHAVQIGLDATYECDPSLPKPTDQ